MELILIFFVFICLVAIAYKQTQNRSNNTQPCRTAATTNSNSERQPFDAQSSQDQLNKVTLQGPAYVIDGDTFVIQKTQIRLFGIDAPEINHPYGKKAKWALFSLCKGEKIRADCTERDAYGRVVARCYLQDGRDISAEMVKLGLAIDWPKFSGGEYRSMEVPGVRKKLWLANARQKGRMHVWEKFEARQNAGSAGNQTHL